MSGELQLFADEPARVTSAKAPDTALVGLLADGLRTAGFEIVDVKDHALLLRAGKREIMIGVRCV